jgi:Protein of unknown function (DUF2905)
MNRPLVVIGLMLLAAGVLWPWLRQLHLFHLPGDIVIDRPTCKFYLPVTSMLLVSAIVSILLWLWRR